MVKIALIGGETMLLIDDGKGSSGMINMSKIILMEIANGKASVLLQGADQSIEFDNADEFRNFIMTQAENQPDLPL